MPAATTALSMITRLGQAASAMAAAATLVAVSPVGSATAANRPSSASATASRGLAAHMCSPVQIAAATCLNYAVIAGGDPWVAAVTSELVQSGGRAIAAKFVAVRGKHFHDAEQAELEALVKGDGAHPDGYLSPAYPPSGVGTAAKGGARWEEESNGQWGPCGDNGCSVYERVTFTYRIATSSHWVLVTRYQNTHGHRYVVSDWECDLRLDQGATSRHLASWSICQEKSGSGADSVIEEGSTITTGDQRNWEFGRFSFELALVDAPYGLVLPITFESKRWYVEGKGGLFY